MQKIKNPILCWIVILAVFIRPTPAQAMVPLAAVAVGAVIAATGVMVAGAGVYKPPTFAQANAAVDSITGDITRKVVVARAFADGVSAGMRGYSGQYILDYNKAMDWIKSHSLDFPALYPAASSSETVSPYVYSVGDVWSTTAAPTVTRKFTGLTLVGWTSPTSGEYPAPYVLPGGWWWNGSTSFWSEKTLALVQGGINYYKYLIWTGTFITTTDSLTPLPVVRNPPAFAAAYPNTEAGQDETDKIAADNPEAIKSEPVPFTPEQIQEAMKQAEKDMLNSQAAIAETLAAADPTNTALQIAAQQARAAADQATIQAEAAKAEVETKPEEAEKTDTPPPAGPAVDADLSLDFSPFLGLKDKAMSKFPFSMVSSLGSLFSGLTSAPVTPSMDVPMPWGIAPKQITLSHWDDFAGKWRMMIALFFHASCIYAIIRRYS